MNSKTVWSIILLICCYPLFAAKQAEDSVNKIYDKNNQQLEAFKKQFGFQGSSYPCGDNRVFVFMNGSFPLPEVVDTLVFEANCRLIISHILSIYQLKGTPFTIERPAGSKIRQSTTPYDSTDKYYSLTFQQYVNGFPLYAMIPVPAYLSCDDKIRGCLEFTYSITGRVYIITNRLLLSPDKLPKPRISKEQAIDLVKQKTQKLEEKEKKSTFNPPPEQITKDLSSDSGLNKKPVHKMYPTKIKDGMHPKGKRLEIPELREYYLSAIPIKGNESKFKYIYVYMIYTETATKNYTFFVDAVTGKLSESGKFRRMRQTSFILE